MQYDSPRWKIDTSCKTASRHDYLENSLVVCSGNKISFFRGQAGICGDESKLGCQRRATYDEKLLLPELSFREYDPNLYSCFEGHSEGLSDDPESLYQPR